MMSGWRTGFAAFVLAALALPASARAQYADGDAVPPHDSFSVASRLLGEARRINVYTPPGYAGSRSRYPVLYMPDGGMGEDFPHLVNTLDSLIRAGRVRPFMVVGIENTERRRDLTGPTIVASDSAIAPHVGGSAAFRAFIRDELMPEVQRRYRTTGETGIIGESLAGLFITETFVLEPRLFDSYIALSPSLWWNRDALLRAAPERLAALPPGRTFYLSAAGEEGIAPQSDTLAQMIHEHAPPRLRFYYHPRPDLEHSTIYRGEGPAALERVFGRR